MDLQNFINMLSSG